MNLLLDKACVFFPGSYLQSQSTSENGYNFKYLFLRGHVPFSIGTLEDPGIFLQVPSRLEAIASGLEDSKSKVSQSPISEPISEISDRKSLDALDALDGNIWKDFDSFNISNFSALEVERFEFHHVLRASDGVRAQIEVHSDLVEGTKVVVKRFPRAYLKDSPAEFRQSNHTLEDPWKEMFLALKLGAPGSASQISGVLPCHGIFIHPSGDVMLFMEYATSGDLFDFATALGEPGPAREAVATQLLRPLVHVVLQLHQMGIAHGDISAENAILCEACVSILLQPVLGRIKRGEISSCVICF